MPQASSKVIACDGLSLRRVKEMQRLAFSACLFDKDYIASLPHKRGTRLCFPPSHERDSAAAVWE